MRGKIGLIVGLGVGYVLGTRAGRARYEQIKRQAVKVWNLPPVQKQVDKVTDAAKRLPGAAFSALVSKAAPSEPTSKAER